MNLDTMCFKISFQPGHFGVHNLQNLLHTDRVKKLMTFTFKLAANLHCWNLKWSSISIFTTRMYFNSQMD